MQNKFIRKYINIILVILIFSLLLLAWVNRWHITKYEISANTEVYIKENIFTGVRCTLREGVISTDRDNMRRIFNFPRWCTKLEYPWNL